MNKLLLSVLGILVLSLSSSVSADWTKMCGEGSISASGSGVGYADVWGSGVVTLSSPAWLSGYVWGDNFQVSQNNGLTVVDGVGFTRFYGVGSLSVTGTSLEVQSLGESMSVDGEGKGGAYLEGEGTCTYYKKGTMVQRKCWQPQRCNY